MDLSYIQNLAEEFRPPTQERVTVRAEILNAIYHPMEKGIIVAVRLPNGQAVAHPMLASSFRQLDGQSADAVDREMEKTAELWRRRRGAHINVEVDKQVLG
jgi:hypothetical protein